MLAPVAELPPCDYSFHSRSPSLTTLGWLALLLEREEFPLTTRLHDLRHTCATLMLAVDTNPKVVQETLGHANVSVTLDTYSHLLPNMQDEVAEKTNELLC